MDDKTYYGSLAEMKVITDLTEKKWHVFNQVSGKAPFDIVVYKDGILKRISIKSCNKEPTPTGKYSIEVGRVRSNKTENKIYKFSKEECDILAVYIVKIDKIIYIDSFLVDEKRQILIGGPQQTEVTNLENWNVGLTTT